MANWGVDATNCPIARVYDDHAIHATKPSMKSKKSISKTFGFEQRTGLSYML